ncbi:tRNA-intron endonuclease catalytic domain-like protein [Artomyces pyxidatus]|uniref:tRNA-intron endonuclease catalytic domain-like protein n=1 Tax=Artomyces pyxidatus TaxID=48021 RepID=A0ACB8SWB9_9AGAM|nr:tRNA-intron endonuclease catalytic domain-like protein [Artomyces pyxidatus]
MAASARTPISIHVSNQRAFVWDPDDAATLRAQHHICGVLAGTLPHLSQQNVFLGLPLILMPEELVLLVEKQLAVLVDDPAAHAPPTPEQLRAWDADRGAGVAQQLARLEREGADRGAEDMSMSAAAVQKRKAREERRQRAREAAVAQGEGSSTQEGAASVFVPPPAPAPPAPASAPAYTVAVPATSDGFSWYAPAGHTYATLDAARAAGVWSYPTTDEERAKCEVFRDLWEQGYFMGGGSKFGGDWLVYPGDPLRYHSHFVATVQASPTAPLWPMEIVAHGRLGTATKKAHLICGWDPEAKTVTYFSIEWAGFG